MSTKPRTPRHYPHMKTRGARRRRLLPLYRLERAADSLVKAVGRTGVSFALAADAMTKLIQASGSGGFKPADASAVAVQLHAGERVIVSRVVTKGQP